MIPDAILFDFDGVLIESEYEGNRHIADYLTGIGHPTTAEESMAAFMGLSGSAFIDAVEGHIGRALPADFAAAREEASAIRTQAQADRAAIVDEARTEARQAAAAVMAAAEASLAADRAQAQAVLTRQIGELAVSLAGKVVGESLTNDARVRQTVDDFIADLERQAAR